MSAVVCRLVFLEIEQIKPNLFCFFYLEFPFFPLIVLIKHEPLKRTDSPHACAHFYNVGFPHHSQQKPSWHLISYHLSKVFTSSNCEWRLALRRRWQPETPFLLSADNETSRLRVGEGSVVARVSASNKQILNSDERPWEGVQGRKALRRGKPMFICNHICDVWQHDSGGGRREKKIPTAALEHFFLSPFDHLNIFAVKDATGEQEKTAVLIKVHFVCVCVFCANSSSWHSLFKDGRGTGWMLNCYVRQIVASDNQQPSAPSLTCHLRPNIIPFSSDHISLLQVANYFFPSLVLKRCSDLEITT